jgi:hypothetical protein
MLLQLRLGQDLSKQTEMVEELTKMAADAILRNENFSYAEDLEQASSGLFSVTEEMSQQAAAMEALEATLRSKVSIKNQKSKINHIIGASASFGPNGGAQFEGHPLPSSRLGSSFSRCARALSSAPQSDAPRYTLADTISRRSNSIQTDHSSPVLAVWMLRRDRGHPPLQGGLTPRLYLAGPRIRVADKAKLRQ